jgi:Mat/Ecp fimbriae major subunit
MKKIILSVIALAAFVLTTAAADNVANKTVSVTGKARIITPITLANTGSQALDFGVIARGTTDATVIVAASASPSANVATGDAVILSSAAQTAAKFTVGGESGKTYVITIPSTTQTIISGANHLDITNFTCSNITAPATSGSATIGTNDVFYVGGTLAVPAAAIAASYTGTFNVTVNYN